MPRPAWAIYPLQLIPHQTEAICKQAVQQDGYALQFVHHQTEAICKLAVQQNGNVLEYDMYTTKPTTFAP